MSNLGGEGRGGVRGKWAIFLVLTAMYVIAYFYRVSAAVIAGDLATDLALSPRQLGNVSALFFYAFALMQLPLGPVLDRFGPRRTVFILGLLAAAGALLFATAGGYAGALLGRGLIGAGTACVLMGSLKVYTAWFSPRQFATLAGLQVALGNLGNLLATSPLAWLAETIGWRWTFGAFSILTALCALAVLVVVRDAPGEASPVRTVSLREGWLSVVREPAVWQLSFLAFFWYGCYMAVQGLWGVPYLVEVLGLDRRGAAGLLMLTAIGFVVGSPLAGYLVDRCGLARKKVLVAGQLGVFLLMSLFLGPLERLSGGVLPAVFFCFGLCVATGPLLYAEVKERFPPQLAGTAMTTVNFFVVLGAAVLQQLMGAILELLRGAGGSAEAGFHGAFAVAAGGLFVAWLGFLRCRETRPA